MNDIDLDIQHYNYSDLLELFQNCNTEQERKTHLNNIKINYPTDIFKFFNQGFVLLSLLEEINVKMFPSHFPKEKKEEFISEIHKIPHFELNSMNQNLQQLFNNGHPIAQEENRFENKIIQTSVDNRDIFIQKPPNMETNKITNSYVNFVTPGDINSLKRLTKTVNLNLNTAFRLQYFQTSSTNFSYAIPNEVKNVVSLGLSSIEIPNFSWYLISADQQNNIFYISIADTLFRIIVPDGNYTSTTLEDYLNSTYFYTSGTINDLQYIQFSINNISNKTSIINNNPNPSIKVQILFLNKDGNNCISNVKNGNSNNCSSWQRTFGWLCGFRKILYMDISDSNPLTSEGLFDDGNNNYFYLAVNDHQNNTNYSNIVTFENSILNDNVIAKIQIIKNSFAYFYNNSILSKTIQYNGPVTLSKLEIKLIDKYGSIISLNSMDFSLTLELEVLYESFNFKNITY